MKISEAVNIINSESSSALNNALDIIVKDIERRLALKRLLGEEADSVKVFENDLGENYRLICDLDYSIDASDGEPTIIAKSKLSNNKVYISKQYIIPCIEYDFKQSSMQEAEVMKTNHSERLYITMMGVSILDLYCYSNINDIGLLAGHVENLHISKYGNNIIDNISCNFMSYKLILNDMSIVVTIGVHDALRIYEDSRNNSLGISYDRLVKMIDDDDRIELINMINMGKEYKKDLSKQYLLDQDSILVGVSLGIKDGVIQLQLGGLKSPIHKEYTLKSLSKENMCKIAVLIQHAIVAQYEGFITDVKYDIGE